MTILPPFGKRTNYLPKFPIGKRGFVVIKKIKKKYSQAFSEKYNGNKNDFNSYELHNDTKHILKKKILNLQLNETINIRRNQYPDDVVAYCMQCFKKEKFSVTLKYRKSRYKRSIRKDYVIKRIR